MHRGESAQHEEESIDFCGKELFDPLANCVQAHTLCATVCRDIGEGGPVKTHPTPISLHSECNLSSSSPSKAKKATTHFFLSKATV